MVIINQNELLNAGTFFGHQPNDWNPKMFPYIYLKKNEKANFINLTKTARLLTYAENYVQMAATEQKTFLFIGTKPQISKIIAKEAEKCGAHYVNSRWLGGILTNWSTIQLQVTSLENFDDEKRNEARTTLGKISKKLGKKELAFLHHKYDKLNKNLGGLRQMTKMPDVTIVVDPNNEKIAIAECKKLKIPVIAIVDTNSNPHLIDIPITANDDDVESIKIILSRLAKGVLQGYSKKSKGFIHS